MYSSLTFKSIIVSYLTKYTIDVCSKVIEELVFSIFFI